METITSKPQVYKYPLKKNPQNINPNYSNTNPFSLVFKPSIYPLNLKIYLFILIFSFLNLFCSNQEIFAQNNTRAKKEFEKALEYQRKGKENKCLESLHKALEIDNNYPDALLFIAEIYYNKSKYFDTIRQKAFPYYQKLISISPDYDINAHFRLGEFYLLEYNTENARQYFQYALSKYKPYKDADKISIVKRKLEQASFIEYSLANPVEFIPKNMGENINTKYDEYLPTLTADEETFLFTRLIPDTSDFGLRIQMVEDFFQAKKLLQVASPNSEQWSKATKLPPPFNSQENEGALSISPDGRVAYFTRCNASDGMGSCDIYFSQREGDRWSEPKNMGANVNSSAWDSQPTIASDGRTLFFVSNRKGGKGGNDIWYTYKQDNGKWTKAKNLDSIINTPGDEMYPFIHPSNTTLYFSSNYHIGMGGMDIFYANIENGIFSQPQNLGYPVNTSNDETSFIVSPSGEMAIYSAELKDSYGGKDLYQFSLPQKAQPTPIVYMKGKVFNKLNKEPLGVSFEVKDLNTNKLIAASDSDPKTGEYLVVLPLGRDYALNTWKEGFLFYSENFNLNDANKKNSYHKDILLTPIMEGESIVLKNIFFETNSAELLPKSFIELEALENLLIKNPNIRIEISGHTDNIGSNEYNIPLSERRAESVRAYLEGRGIEKNRMDAKGYGSNKPIADNSTQEGKALNRRTEFKIIKK